MERGRKSEPMEAPCRDREESAAYPEGIKWTKQRKAVYRALWEADSPLSAQQIYRRAGGMGEDGEAYAFSTIYRILGAFEEKGLLEKTAWMGESEDGHTTMLYELKKGGHTHYAVCLECRRRIPLKNCPFAGLHLEKETEEFTVTDHKLELYGYCRDCRKPEKE